MLSCALNNRSCALNNHCSTSIEVNKHWTIFCTEQLNLRTILSQTAEETFSSHLRLPCYSQKHTCLHTCGDTYIYTCTDTYIHRYIDRYMHTYMHSFIDTFIHTSVIYCAHFPIQFGCGAFERGPTPSPTRVTSIPSGTFHSGKSATVIIGLD